MTKLHQLFIKPFTAKGFVWGTVDLCVKALAFFIWAYLTYILLSLIGQSFALDYNPLTRLWWVSYSFLIFFGASLLAYIAVFVRDYNEEAEEEITEE